MNLANEYVSRINGLKNADQKSVPKLAGERVLYRVWNHTTLTRWERKQAESFCKSTPGLPYWLVSSESIALMKTFDTNNARKFKSSNLHVWGLGLGIK